MFGVLLATTGACSLVISVPTDEYANGAVVSGPDAADGASSGADAPRDVRAPVAACGDATFCETFDEGPLGAKWPEQDTDDGELALAPSSVGPPNALRVKLPERASSERERVASLARSFPFPTRARCDFDLFAAGGPPGTNDVELLALRARNGGTHYSLHVKLRNDALRVRESITGESTTSSEVPRTFREGAWVHVVLEAEMGKQAVVTFGQETATLMLRAFGGSQFALSLGETGDNGRWGFEVLIDNVACTFTP